MAVRIKTRIIDWIDTYYLKAMGMNIPPHSLRSRVGRVEGFEQVPPEFIAYFKLLCGLQMNETILDIGCGPGRFASQLIGSPNFFRGKYCGFDVDKRAINWANANITAYHENFEFTHVDLFNGLYNPHGKLNAENFSFPYEDEQFDFVFAISVFTHLLPEGTNNYIKEINRVLKPKGKALVTFLLLNGYSQILNRVTQERMRQQHIPTTWHHHDVYSVIYPNKPELAVAYQESAVKRIMKECNLNVEKRFYGAWNKAENYLSMQDILILRKQ